MGKCLPSQPLFPLFLVFCVRTMGSMGLLPSVCSIWYRRAYEGRATITSPNGGMARRQGVKWAVESGLHPFVHSTNGYWRNWNNITNTALVLVWATIGRDLTEVIRQTRIHSHFEQCSERDVEGRSETLKNRHVPHRLIIWYRLKNTCLPFV